MSDEMTFAQNEDGTFSTYDDTYDIVIHCETEDERKKVIERLKAVNWIPVSADVMIWAVMNMRRSVKSMKLIDADKIIQEMRKWYWDKEKQKAAENDVSPMDLFTHLAITTVREQPAAFDVDKVVEQLDVYITKLVGRNSALYQTVMQIVKGGGVE